MEEMNKLLKDLDLYRKFPRFQLERHFDIILLNYIPAIINHFNSTSFSLVIPEYPISKKALHDKHRSPFESVAFDYAIFDPIKKTVGIIELKTEPASNRDKQDKYLETIEKEFTSEELLQFIINRVNHKPRNQAQAKYQFLMHYLEKNNCMFLNKNPVKTYKISPYNKKLKPNEYISFKDIAAEVIIPNDPLWPEVCRYLTEWSKPMTVDTLNKSINETTPSGVADERTARPL